MQIYSNMCFKNPEYTILSFDSASFKDALTTVEELSRKYYLLGYIRYEAKDVFLNQNVTSSFPLLYFEAYKDYEEYIPRENSQANLNLLSDITFEEYKKALTAIKNEIAQGNTYEVNYTYDSIIKTDSDPLTLYQTLLKRQKTPYNAFIQNSYETILSFSPELFFEKEGDKILTKPMKGTVKRGSSEKEDRENIEFLRNDIKNRAENVMIVDLLRNDLGRIAKTGTVKVPKLFEIETHKTLHQMTSTITAELKDNTSLYDIFEAVFPCGSITGAPKISTMNIIDRLEKGKRNVYCGAIGFLTPDKHVFSVPIRILQKKSNEDCYRYRAGGAIVWDSDIKDEWDETITKTSFLNSNCADNDEDNEDFKIIETFKAENGTLLFAKEHFERMEKSARRFGFVFPDDLKTFTPEKDGMVRILLNKDGSFDVQYKELSNARSFKIEISPHSIDSSEEYLFHKTTIRPWYKNASEKINNNEVYDVIFFNEKNELTEGSRTNILLKIDEKLYTPPAKCGLLEGVFRRRLLEEQKCEEKVLYKSDLKKAEKIFCINSVRGIVEVQL